ncbi:MAG: IS66 family insertion sequence element accessory protein TnpB [Alkalilacustris sp.]
MANGLVLIYKRLEASRFQWPQVQDGVLRISRGQYEALFWSAPLRMDRLSGSDLTGAGLSKEECPCLDAIAATAPSSSARSSPSIMAGRASMLLHAATTSLAI